jgi:hypothetical protein
MEPSATAYIDRDGTVVRAIDPARHAAWSQGDVAHLNTRLPTIAAAVTSGVSMNEWVHDLRARSGLTTEQPIYRGRPEGWLEVSSLESC